MILVHRASAGQKNKIQGTFLKKDDPKISALMQQAELLSLLAQKVDTENMDQSLENVWKVRMIVSKLNLVFLSLEHFICFLKNELPRLCDEQKLKTTDCVSRSSRSTESNLSFVNLFIWKL